MFITLYALHIGSYFRRVAKNNVDMDMKTLYHISYLLKQHETSYNLTAARVNPDEISFLLKQK